MGGIKFYVREFGMMHAIETDSETYPISGYFKGPILTTFIQSFFRNKIIKDTDYILGPVYHRKKDFQVGVTGTAIYDEDFQLAMIRELGEEIGLIPKKAGDLEFVQQVQQGRNQLFNTYILPMKKTNPVSKKCNNVKVASGKDDRSRKVGCLVFGSKQEIAGFLNSDDIYIFQSEDGIMGIGAIQVKDVCKHFGLKEPPNTYRNVFSHNRNDGSLARRVKQHKTGSPKKTA